MKKYSIVLILMFIMVKPGGFEESTLIAAPYAYVSLKNLTLLEQIVSYSIKSKQSIMGRLLYKVPYTSQSTLELTFEAQGVCHTLLCDINQLFRSNEQWIQASDLQEGTYVATLNAPALLIKKELIHQKCSLLCISVSPPFCYCVTPLNIVVHNEFITISLTYMIGQGFIWPTLAGFVSAAACCALKFVVNRIDGAHRPANAYYESHNIPNVSHQQSSGTEPDGEQPPTPPEPEDNNSDTPFDAPPHDDHSDDEFLKAGAGAGVSVLSNKKTRQVIWTGAHHANNKVQRAATYAIGKVKEGAKKAINPHGVCQKGDHKSFDYGSKSRKVINEQKVLDRSIEVPNPNRAISQRVAWEDKNTIAIFKPHTPGNYHSHTTTWKNADQEIRNALIKGGLATHSGKMIK